MTGITGLLTAEERNRLETAQFGRPVGFGKHPAALIIDLQNYMVGPRNVGDHREYPSACGPQAQKAIPPIQRILALARSRGWPIIFTQFILRRDGQDIGVYGRKRPLLNVEGWCLEGSVGAEIVPDVAPNAEDIVLVKKKPSAFIGTPLLNLLIERHVDTVIVMGGSTSNCVRATVVDAMSFNFRPIVVEDGVFDRVRISHDVALFDIARQYGDVVSSQRLFTMVE